MSDWQWGKGGGDQVEEKVIELVNRFKKNRPPGKTFMYLGLLVVLIWAAMTSLYKVETEETGVILRFGRFAGLAQPGLHAKLPFSIDRVYRVKTARVLKEEFGFRTARPGVRTSYSPEEFDEESLILTGDLNVTDVEWIVQYQIADPFKYLFNIRSPRDALRDISEAMVRRVVGNANETEVLTTKRPQLAAAIEADLQETLDSYDIGVRIVTVKFQNVLPPDPVKPAFNDVNESEQQKESLIFQAREQYNREVPKARGVAQRTIQEAEGYAIERINRANGEAARYLALLKEYRKAPEVTRRRLHLETMEEILPRLEEVYIMDEKGTGLLPLLPLRGQGKGGQS